MKKFITILIVIVLGNFTLRLIGDLFISSEDFTSFQDAAMNQLKPFNLFVVNAFLIAMVYLQEYLNNRNKTGKTD